jgi:hypothetical protein
MSLVEHYERLRQEVMSLEYAGGRASGLSVFLLRGMVGWMEVLSALEPVSAEVMECPSTASPEVASESRPAIVHILANMVLSCLGGSA